MPTKLTAEEIAAIVSETSSHNAAVVGEIPDKLDLMLECVADLKADVELLLLSDNKAINQLRTILSQSLENLTVSIQNNMPAIFASLEVEWPVSPVEPATDPLTP
jgi:hypothetical protein